MAIHLLAYDIVKHFADVPRGTLVPLGNHGGFSGAHLFRLDTPAGSYALKAWPATVSAERLAWIHALLAKAGLPWLPRVMAAADGATIVTEAGPMLGAFDLDARRRGLSPSSSLARLSAALSELAQLHETWRKIDTRAAICPAVLRRLDSWQTWTRLVQSGWRPNWTALDPYAAIAQELWRILQNCGDDVPCLLTPWLSREVPVQPCVCDLWHDHVLFTGDAVTGIIDFGSVKIDHVSVDLARLLGSLIGDDAAAWQIGISSYQQIRPLAPLEIELAHVLDRTGALIAATHWLRWLYHEGRVYDSPTAVIGRLDHLRSRLTAESASRAP